jgi:hypothetical protein
MSDKDNRDREAIGHLSASSTMVNLPDKCSIQMWSKKFKNVIVVH